MIRTLMFAFAGMLASASIPVSSALADEDMTMVPPAATAQANPLLTPSTLPFHAPPFDRIKDSDFQPAFEAGIKQQLAEVDTIANDPAPASFENTLVALEKSGQLLTRVEQVFNGLTSANTDPVLQKVQEEMAPKLAAVQDAIFLNDKLFKRVEKIYAERHVLKLDPESHRLIEYYHQQFVLAGAKLSDADKARLKQLNEEEATLSARFVNQLLAANKAGALVVSDKAELAGLSEDELEAAAQAAKARGLEGRWVIPLQNTTQQPDLQSLSDRATREKLFEASWIRAERGDANDTRATIAHLAQLRAEQAKLLGYPDYATWKLQDQMAKTPAHVEQFLDQLIPPATAKATAEAADIQALIDQQHGGFKLEAMDWDFYAEQVRKAKYHLDDAEIKPYFELNRVLTDGVFYAANQLYGLTFKERHDIPVYQKDVRVFEVYDSNRKPLGLFYCDYFKRDNKTGGAWMDNFVTQSKLLEQQPVIYNVTNFPEPPPGKPALLNITQVITLFHEFGHALHGFFADQEYPSLSGTAVARDYVEYPSQFNEHWALNPKVLAHYAFNYKTGEPMPQSLVDKIKKAEFFNKGYDMTEMLAAAELDMQWHTLPADAPLQDVDKFETAALQKTHVYMPQVPTRYHSSYFMHIWGNGYQAGYYAYLWTQMLADDSYQWFLDHGGLTRANGQRYRDLILSRGNTEDYARMFRNFYGHDPQIGPMLKYRGLSGS
ncbi:MAG: peptidyl-dipeptidase Dcp [Gammaproteobacteria bacterium]|nr:peptidyl-dipeptidase Dcp [Gammaproteobacteria bacterium]